MKELIRHIIKEETDQVVGGNSRQDKIRSMIEDIGILNTIKSIGGFDNFKRFVGKDFLDFDYKITLISEIAEEYGDRNGNLILVYYNLDIVLEKEETSLFISRKIYKAFVSPSIDESFVSQMATRFRKSNYDIGDLMRFVFLSDHFYIKENRGVLIKSPVELIAEYKVLFQLKMKNADNMIKLQRGLGQVLFMPPNVAGWPGDRNWIDSTSLLVRVNLPSLFSGKITYTPKDKELPETESIKDKSKLPFLCSMNFEKFESGFKNLSVFDLIIHPTSVEAPSVMNQLNSAEEKAIYFMSLPEFQLH
jgi:hypothetical protein